MPEGDGAHAKTALQPGNDADYGLLGVRAKRDEHPVRPPPIDRQRIYTGLGTAGMGTTPRFKNTGGSNISGTSPSGFKGRKRTLKG